MRFKNKNITLFILAIMTVLMAVSSQNLYAVKAEEVSVTNEKTFSNDDVSLIEITNSDNDMSVEIEPLNEMYLLTGNYKPDTSLLVIFSTEIEYEIITDNTGDFTIDLTNIDLNETEFKIKSADEELLFHGRLKNKEDLEIASEQSNKINEKNTNTNNTTDNTSENQLNSTNSSPTKISENNGTKYHYVESGETLYSISNFHGVDVKDLQAWNKLNSSVNIRPGDILSVNGYNIYDKLQSETIKFSSTSQFINYIAPIVQEVAKEYGIYSSIMMGQLILESNSGTSKLAISGNNLGGVKGTHNGNSIYTITKEEIDGKLVTVRDQFRLYPTYKYSIIDNADKIKNGTTWDNTYYEGAWIENTASHRDAAEWLTGRYATDSAYGEKLNNLIDNYNLTQYDKHVSISNPIISQRNFNSTAQVTNKSFPIYSQPFGTASYEIIGNTEHYSGEIIEIKKEKINNLATWYLIFDGNKELGWVEEDAVTFHPILSTKDVNYTAEVIRTWSINSRPWGTDGFKEVDTGASYLGQVVKVIQEKETPRGVYALIKINDKEIGWIDKGALNQVDSVLTTKSANYIAKVIKSWSINTQPWGTVGSEFIMDASSYLEKDVTVVQEKITSRSTYGLLEYNGKELGWFDTRGLEKQQVLAVKDTNYMAKVEKSWSINTRPWGIDGFEFIEDATSYINKDVKVIQEKLTTRATYGLLEYNGKKLGWFDIRGLTKQEVLSVKDVKYQARVIKTWSINSRPWGVDGFQEIDTGASYLNNIVEIIQEKETPRSTYALISVNGKNIGWIDREGLDIHPVLSTKNTNYVAKIEKSWSINTKPWGVQGYEFIEDASAYIGDEVVVIQEIETPRSVYGLLERNGKKLGWFDTKGLEIQRVLSTRKTNYIAKIEKAWSINTLPWGVNGYELIENASSYIGEDVTVIQEIVTPRSVYGLLQIKGRELGWFDTNGLEIQKVTSTKDVKYNATIIHSWSINTKPWGVDGFKLVESATSYLGKTISVIQEKQTTRGIYVLIKLNNQELGWIDKRAIEPHQVVLDTYNVNYVADIIKSWSINTLPWGVDGSKPVSTDGRYMGRTVVITQEKVTPRSTYGLITIDDKEIGWIDVEGLEKHKVLSTRNTNYIAEVEKPWTLNTQPWGVEGFKLIEDASAYVGKTVEVIREKKTIRSTYGLLTLDGKELGWFDIDGLNIQRVLSTKNTNYNAIIEKSWSLNTQPWGTNGYKFIEQATPYVGELVTVVQEKVTPRSTYALLKLNGKELGWFDIRGLKSNPVIYLDAGHGGTDTGAHYGGIAEREINLKVSKKIETRLKNLGYEVVMSRNSQSNSYSNTDREDLFARPAHANRINADIYVSVHHNAMPGNSNVSGIETYYYGVESNYPPLPENSNSHNDPKRIADSIKLANQIHNELIGSTGAIDRGVRSGSYVVVRETKMPAVLLELGYMSNSLELQRINSDSYQNKLADSVVKGINSYFGRK